MTYPGLIFWLLVFSTALVRGPAFYYVFFAGWSFGTLTVVPFPAVGNLTPPWIAACVLTARVVLEAGAARYLSALIDPRRFGFLTLCTLYAAGSAYFLPRLFDGQVNVVTMRPSDVRGAVPLRPDGANVTQTLYFIITTLSVVSVYFIGMDPLKRRRFLRSLAFGAMVAILTGLLDLFTSTLGMAALLEPFRNSKYALMLENEAAGMHRVVGLMSEASAYAGLCLPFLAILALTPARDSAWGRWRLPLSAGLGLMTFLSTSSAGYVALGALAAVLGASFALGALQQRRAAWWGCYGVLAGAGALAAVGLLNPGVFEPFMQVLDGVVLQKSATDSYVERTMWNRVAYEAFVGTHYLGVGMGGARASSWIYSVLSNIGLPGALLLLIFMLQVFLGRAAHPQDRSLLRAVKLALAPGLFMASLAGTTAGFGLHGAAFFGLASALCWPAAARPAEAAAARPGSTQVAALA